MRLTEIKEQVGSLERALERDVAKGAASSSGHRSSALGMVRGSMRRGSCVTISRGGGEGDDEDGDEVDGEYEEGEEYAESTPFVTEDVAYDENETDELMDLGIQVGKLRITDRIGGMSRPRLAEEVSTLLNLPLVDCASAEERGRGKDANECLTMTDLRRYWEPSHGEQLVHAR